MDKDSVVWKILAQYSRTAQLIVKDIIDNSATSEIRYTDDKSELEIDLDDRPSDNSVSKLVGKILSKLPDRLTKSDVKSYDPYTSSYSDGDNEVSVSIEYDKEEYKVLDETTQSGMVGQHKRSCGDLIESNEDQEYTIVEDYDDEYDESEDDSFYVLITDDDDNKLIIQISKYNGEWEEYKIYLDDEFGYFDPRSYMSYLNKSDIMQWIRQDYPGCRVSEMSDNDVEDFLNNYSDADSEPSDEDEDVRSESWWIGDRVAVELRLSNPYNDYEWNGWIEKSGPSYEQFSYDKSLSQDEVIDKLSKSLGSKLEQVSEDKYNKYITNDLVESLSEEILTDMSSDEFEVVDEEFDSDKIFTSGDFDEYKDYYEKDPEFSVADYSSYADDELQARREELYQRLLSTNDYDESRSLEDEIMTIDSELDDRLNEDTHPADCICPKCHKDPCVCECTDSDNLDEDITVIDDESDDDSEILNEVSDTELAKMIQDDSPKGHAKFAVARFLDDLNMPSLKINDFDYVNSDPATKGQPSASTELEDDELNRVASMMKSGKLKRGQPKKSSDGIVTIPATAVGKDKDGNDKDGIYGVFVQPSKKLLKVVCLIKKEAKLADLAGEATSPENNPENFGK